MKLSKFEHVCCRLDEACVLCFFLSPTDVQTLCLTSHYIFTSIIDCLLHRDEFCKLWRKAWPGPLRCIRSKHGHCWERAIVFPDWISTRSKGSLAKSVTDEEISIDIIAPRPFCPRTIIPEWKLAVEWSIQTTRQAQSQHIVEYGLSIDLTRERVGIAHLDRIPRIHPLNGSTWIRRPRFTQALRILLSVATAGHWLFKHNATRPKIQAETRSDGSIFVNVIADFREVGSGTKGLSFRLLPGPDIRAALWLATQVWGPRKTKIRKTDT